MKLECSDVFPAQCKNANKQSFLINYLLKRKKNLYAFKNAIYEPKFKYRQNWRN